MFELINIWFGLFLVIIGAGVCYLSYRTSKAYVKSIPWMPVKYGYAPTIVIAIQVVVSCIAVFVLDPIVSLVVIVGAVAGSLLAQSLLSRQRITLIEQHWQSLTDSITPKVKLEEKK